MDTSKILTDLRVERDHIDQAIAALEALNGSNPLGGEVLSPASRPKAAAAKPGRNISPEGRARIVAAAKKMWAKRRKGAKPAAAGRGAKPAAKAVAPGARTMSPAARRRIAEAMKKRWAQKKRAKAA